MNLIFSKGSIRAILKPLKRRRKLIVSGDGDDEVYISAPIDQIIELAKIHKWIPSNVNSFETITKNSERCVKSTCVGNVKFRLGVHQRVKIEENKL